mmetsp:Transcript_16924/g.50541  ORF Transcript_16924/g.50541 Transcript_16924/m.50541 type:complete len:574 (+) Transcript_16924:156-1877(+)
MSHFLNLLGRSLPSSVGSIQDFDSYKDAEKSRSQHGSSEAQMLLCQPDYATLSLRIDPATVSIEQRDDSTWVTVDSANFPGILVSVIQHLMELNLLIASARVSSDGTFFLDVFEVKEVGGGPVTCPRKLASIQRMLNINYGDDELPANGDETDDAHKVETTVFELAGRDSAGLLAEVTRLLTDNGCDVRSAAVWTYASRVAFVLSVTAKGEPIRDEMKLQRLRQMLLNIMSSDGRGTVNSRKVRGEVHHDRRLHQLMLAEAARHFDGTSSGASLVRSTGSFNAPGGPYGSTAGGTYSSATGGSPPHLANMTSLSDSATSVHSDLAEAAYLQREDSATSQTMSCRSLKYSRPDVEVTSSGRSGYWTVIIVCKDRPKLLFDTVCTLADCGYEVFHATVDSVNKVAQQEFYVRPRGGFTAFNDRAAAKLRAMLEASVQRRFPKGLKVHVHSVDRFGCLAGLTKVLQQADLSITRAKVKTYAVNNSSGHTFYVMNADGSFPDQMAVQEACNNIGGRLVESGDEAASCSPSEASSGTGLSGSMTHKFSFSILNRRLDSGWRGSPGENSPTTMTEMPSV